jgi:predicted alpha/beta-fold hydrolase
MPLIRSSFNPPPLLRNGHLQTVLGALLRRRMDGGFECERLELPDGDFLDLRWLRRGSDRLAILSHGLEGSADDGSMRGMAMALRDAGWDALAWNFRGCSGEPNRLARFYHSGETADLGAVIRHGTGSGRYSRVALIGFSLGGNLILKYLGEAPPHPAVTVAAAISAPIDLAASAHVLDQQWDNRIYLRRFMRRLLTKVEAKALHFPDELDVRGSRSIRTFRQFDDRFTAPLHGFRDAADYWARSSALQFLPRITVPALLINALDDPFLAPSCFPTAEAERSPAFHLEAPRSGGHLGFLDLRHGFQPWTESRVPEFFKTAGG